MCGCAAQVPRDNPMDGLEIVYFGDRASPVTVWFQDQDYQEWVGKFAGGTSMGTALHRVSMVSDCEAFVSAKGAGYFVDINGRRNARSPIQTDFHDMIFHRPSGVIVGVDYTAVHFLNRAGEKISTVELGLDEMRLTGIDGDHVTGSYNSLSAEDGDEAVVWHRFKVDPITRTVKGFEVDQA